MSRQSFTALALPLALAGVVVATPAHAQGQRRGAAGDLGSLVNQGTFSSVLRARSIGPALTSGRICDFAFNPEQPSEHYVAVCSGGVWKTTNNGTTYTPIFDNQGSYSIGVVEMDPNNSSVIWVGTGENNSQRSVAWGDGVYKSEDGGASWRHMGLKDSQHIGTILIDPRDSDHVYVASQGPLWNSGGDRGLYETHDGGETWSRILHISDDTGINEVHMDPRNPDVLYASAYQRRRHVWTLIDGGPESGVYKSEDGGVTWTELTRGLPGGDKGRIGMAVSPANPDYVYAIVEARRGQGGFYRSTNRGASWRRMSNYVSSSPQYYQELFADPIDPDKVYAVNTVTAVTTDGGVTFSGLSTSGRHVDDHVVWIDPRDTTHLYIGGDGGVYESFDSGSTWVYKENLPLTQFYRVAVDNAEPFYNVYGGTQDNNTQGGPSRTTNARGILSDHWYITVGGDGFEVVVDPTNPNIVYSESQHGGLVRYDKSSGETVSIKPREKPGEAYVWNWDSPIILSPHDHKRVYFAADRVFRSDDYGGSWRDISGDLTRQVDRNTLEVMGRIQGPSAVARHSSTSIYGNIVSLSESPLHEGLIYAGADDGLIQVTENGGEEWRKEDSVPGVPHLTYVTMVFASLHDSDTVYATFGNHKMGDFTPYVLVSRDRGRTWESIAGDLPEDHMVYAIQQDHVNPDLLFVGTEFGAFFSVNHGKNWVKIAGLPTISVRDLDIQRRENDLAMATFGRSFYVLDDYTPLRHVTAEHFRKDAFIFPVRDAKLFVPRRDYGAGSQGSTQFRAANPPSGAVFRLYMQNAVRVPGQQRPSRDPSYQPTADEYRAQEDEVVTPRVYMTIRDADGGFVNNVNLGNRAGMQQAVWNLRYSNPGPIGGAAGGGGRFGGRFGGGGGAGPYVAPGTYAAQVMSEVNGEVAELTESVSFEVESLGQNTFEDQNRADSLAFLEKVSDLQRAVQGAQRVAGEAGQRIGVLRTALTTLPDADVSLIAKVNEMQIKLNAINRVFSGDRAVARAGDQAPVGLSSHIGAAWSPSLGVTSAPTGQQREQYEFAAQLYEGMIEDLRTLVESDIPEVEKHLDDIDAPWTPGRFPVWKR